LAETVDGILFTGGHDISPALYGQEKLDVCELNCAERDETERLLFTEALRLDIPAFGICRGIQLFNVLLGGNLYQDIPSQMHSQVPHKQQPPYNLPSHDVQIVGGTPLHTLLGEKSLSVNSCHHQGICELASDLVIMAQAPDGLAEAVYMPGKAFVWAVQWHPEFTLDAPASHALFSAFVMACAKHTPL
jgi:putative glutamine amidotransferase